MSEMEEHKELSEAMEDDQMSEALDHMVHNVTSPTVLQNVIKKLSLRLNDLWESTLGAEHGQSIEINEQEEENTWVDHLIDGHVGVQLLHPDTVILMVSCIVMIIVGLLLRKAFLYLTFLRERRERYRGGLRQLAEHMHVVTHTMSTSPGDELKLTKTPSLTFAQLKMAEPDDAHGQDELERRRLSKMHNFLANSDRQ